MTDVARPLPLDTHSRQTSLSAADFLFDFSAAAPGGQLLTSNCATAAAQMASLGAFVNVDDARETMDVGHATDALARGDASDVPTRAHLAGFSSRGEKTFDGSTTAHASTETRGGKDEKASTSYANATVRRITLPSSLSRRGSRRARLGSDARGPVVARILVRFSHVPR